MAVVDTKHPTSTKSPVRVRCWPGQLRRCATNTGAIPWMELRTAFSAVRESTEKVFFMYATDEKVVLQWLATKSQAASLYTQQMKMWYSSGLQLKRKLCLYIRYRWELIFGVPYQIFHTTLVTYACGHIRRHTAAQRRHSGPPPPTPTYHHPPHHHLPPPTTTHQPPPSPATTTYHQR